jgi:hypothetical protein
LLSGEAMIASKRAPNVLLTTHTVLLSILIERRQIYPTVLLVGPW